MTNVLRPFFLFFLLLNISNSSSSSLWCAGITFDLACPIFLCLSSIWISNRYLLRSSPSSSSLSLSLESWTESLWNRLNSYTRECKYKVDVFWICKMSQNIELEISLLWVKISVSQNLKISTYSTVTQLLIDFSGTETCPIQYTWSFDTVSMRVSLGSRWWYTRLSVRYFYFK